MLEQRGGLELEQPRGPGLERAGRHRRDGLTQRRRQRAAEAKRSWGFNLSARSSTAVMPSDSCGFTARGASSSPSASAENLLRRGPAAHQLEQQQAGAEHVRAHLQRQPVRLLRRHVPAAWRSTRRAARAAPARAPATRGGATGRGETPAASAHERAPASRAGRARWRRRAAPPAASVRAAARARAARRGTLPPCSETLPDSLFGSGRLHVGRGRDGQKGDSALQGCMKFVDG